MNIKPDPTGTHQSRPPVFAGVDTHKDVHVAAVVDATGTMLGTGSFATTRAGYRALLAWVRSHGELIRIGIEGTGSYGAGLTRHLAKHDVTVLEVDRPDRSERRRKGKDDDLDAINAARGSAPPTTNHDSEVQGRRSRSPSNPASGTRPSCPRATQHTATATDVHRRSSRRGPRPDS